MTDELVDGKEMARRIAVSPATVRRWAQNGIIPVVRLSNRTQRYDPAAVIAALKRRAISEYPSS